MTGKKIVGPLKAVRAGSNCTVKSHSYRYQGTEKSYTVEPHSYRPVTNRIPLIADANSWSLQGNFFYFLFW